MSGRIRFSLAILALLLGGPVTAAEHPFPVRVELDDVGEAEMFLRKLDFNVDAAFDGWARVYVNEEELVKLRTAGFSATRLPDDGPRMAELARVQAAETLHTPEGTVAAQYHTYETLEADLKQIAMDHPSIVRLTSIGKTVEDRDLWIVKLTDNPDAEEYEPGVTYISSMHGDEVVGKELLYNLIDYMTDNYGIDPRVTQLIDSTEIWIMPSMNPDGTEAGSRYNADGLDLNREFPDQFVDPVNTTAGRPPEVAAIMNWRAQHTSTLATNMHGGALVANYPFDSNPAGTSTFSPTPQPDHDTFVRLARTYADNNPPMSMSNSHPAWDDGITNGAEWYAINGGMQDWKYLWYGDHEVLVEVSSIKWPPANQLPDFWADNLESMLVYMERAHEGVRGLVTDQITGLPLAATIYIDGSPNPTYTDPEVGDYHRVVAPGTYKLNVVAPYYEPRAFPAVTVNDGPSTVIDVALVPSPIQLQPFAFELQDGGDGIFDPGELSSLAVTLQNLGQSATNVSAELIPTGYFGSVSQAHAEYPDIGPGATGLSNAPHYDVLLDAAAPAGHRAGYALRWVTDQGVGESEPFFIDVGAAINQIVASADVPYGISNTGPQPVSSEIIWTAEAEIVAVRVAIDLTHTYIGDLLVELVSPAGTRVRLHDHSGGSQDDIIGTYGVDLTALESLSTYTCEQANGTWTLEITDDFGGDNGTLNAWSLEIDGRPVEPVPPAVKFRGAEMLSGVARFEWWPYSCLDSYRVYRATDPGQPGNFSDVTAEDADPTDTLFDDASADPISYFLVTGVGRNGEGP